MAVRAQQGVRADEGKGVDGGGHKASLRCRRQAAIATLFLFYLGNACLHALYEYSRQQEQGCGSQEPQRKPSSYRSIS